jgi:hypothetical protein
MIWEYIVFFLLFFTCHGAASHFGMNNWLQYYEDAANANKGPYHGGSTATALIMAAGPVVYLHRANKIS